MVASVAKILLFVARHGSAADACRVVTPQVLTSPPPPACQVVIVNNDIIITGLGSYFAPTLTRVWHNTVLWGHGAA